MSKTDLSVYDYYSAKRESLCVACGYNGRDFNSWYSYQYSETDDDGNTCYYDTIVYKCPKCDNKEEK